MRLIRYLLHGYLYLSYGFHRLTQTGPFGRNRAEYIDTPPEIIGNPLKKALFKHHVKQFHDAACSVATVAGIINALKDITNQDTQPITQFDVLEKIRTAHWKERMSDGGYNGRRGLPLPVLSIVVQDSLNAYNIQHVSVETIQAHKQPQQAKQVQALLQQRLRSFEQKGACLIIAHFDQGTYVQSLNIPHISPIGGFDKVRGDVTMLDVDPLQPKPYKISFNTFYKGFASNYHNVFRFFGYGRGGCIIINLS